jgi:hypothetical protein
MRFHNFGRRSSVVVALGILVGLSSSRVAAQVQPPETPVVTFVAGGNESGYADGIGSAATFRIGGDLALDPAGNVLVADSSNNRIRKVTPTGTVSTYAGTGSTGLNASVDGPAETARFSGTGNIVVSSDGTAYVSEVYTNRIRKLSPTGIVTTFAGSGQAGYADGIGEAAMFSGIGGLALDQQGNLYVSEYRNLRIRKITPAGLVTTFAGNGTWGTSDGDASTGQLSNPGALVVAPDGTIYVSDRYTIRRVDTLGRMATFSGQPGYEAGPGYLDGPRATATFTQIRDLAIDVHGNLFVLDLSTLRKIDLNGIVSTVIYNPTFWYQYVNAHVSFGPLTSGSGLGRPSALDFDQQGNLYIETSEAPDRPLIARVTGLASPVRVVDATTTALASQVAPWSVGVPGVFTATTTSSAAAPIYGTIELREGSTVLSTQTVGPTGVTNFSVTLPVGTHAVSAVYLGSPNNSPSTSSQATVEVLDPGLALLKNYAVSLPVVYQSPLLQVASAGTVSNLSSASSLRALNNPEFPLAFQVTVPGPNKCWTVPGSNPERMAALTGLESESTPKDITVATCDAANQAQWFYLEHGSLSAEGTWLYEIRPAWNITLWAQSNYFQTTKRCVRLDPNLIPAPVGKHPVLAPCASFGSDLSQFWSIGSGGPNTGNGKIVKFDGLNDAPARRYDATGFLVSKAKGRISEPCSATLTVLDVQPPGVPDLSKIFVSTAAHCIVPYGGAVPKTLTLTFSLATSSGDRTYCARYSDIRIGKYESSLDTEEDYAFVKISRECDQYGRLIPGGQEAFQLTAPARYCNNCGLNDSVFRTASFPGDVPQLGQAESVRVSKESPTKFTMIAALEGGSSGGRIGTRDYIAGVISAKDSAHSGSTFASQYDPSIKPTAGYLMVGARFSMKRTFDLATTVSNLRSSIK